MDQTKHGEMLADLKSQALQNPDTSYPADLAPMCDLATYWSSKSHLYNSGIPASGVVSNTAGEDDNRKAGDKGQKRSVNANAKDAKPDRKGDC